MKNRYPSREELYALEAKARRMRSEEVARWMRAAASALRSLFSAKGVKGLRHA